MNKELTKLVEGLRNDWPEFKAGRVKAFKKDASEAKGHQFTNIGNATVYLTSTKFGVPYTVGSMARDMPIGFAEAKKYGVIAKWYHIDRSDYDKLDGVLLSNDFRNGNVYIVFRSRE